MASDELRPNCQQLTPALNPRLRIAPMPFGSESNIGQRRRVGGRGPHDQNGTETSRINVHWNPWVRAARGIRDRATNIDSASTFFQQESCKCTRGGVAPREC